MTRIDANAQYVLIPVHEDGFDIPSRGFFGKDLLKDFNEDILIDALENGKVITYKGNDYFIDEKL